MKERSEVFLNVSVKSTKLWSFGKASCTFKVIHSKLKLKLVKSAMAQVLMLFIENKFVKSVTIYEL